MTIRYPALVGQQQRLRTEMRVGELRVIAQRLGEEHKKTGPHADTENNSITIRGVHSYSM